MFFKLLFETCVAHDMPCALEKITMVEVTGHIQPRASSFCDKTTVFARMFISTLQVPVTIKLDRMVTYLKEFEASKSDENLIT